MNAFWIGLGIAAAGFFIGLAIKGLRAQIARWTPKQRHMAARYWAFVWWCWFVLGHVHIVRSVHGIGWMFLFMALWCGLLTETRICVRRWYWRIE